MGKADVLFYERDFTKPKVDSSFFKSEEYLQSKKRIGEWLYKEILKKPMPDFSDQKEPKQEDLLNQWLWGDIENLPIDDIFMEMWCDDKGDEVVLPCPPQAFLSILKRFTEYARDFDGTIKLLRNGKTLMLFIEATTLYLNGGNIKFFEYMFNYTMNISFFTTVKDNVMLILEFDNVGADSQTLDLAAFRALMAEMDEYR